MTSFTLVADEPAVAGRVRTYHAHHGPALRMRWALTVDDGGLLLDIDGRPD